MINIDFPKHPPIHPKTWQFWRNIIVFFCAFSVIGHTCVEFPYCAFGAIFFDSVSWTDDVLANPLKPFLVYGVSFSIIRLTMVPLKEKMLEWFPKKRYALLVFYIISVFVGMAGELIQGFLQNQPVDGVYPLWDVSNYPGNILGQAWIVNDIFLGLLITAATWLIIPYCEQKISKLNERQANINCGIVVLVFVFLCALTYYH